MTLDKKELSKLSPEERIKKLKLMEEERKKEVHEIEQLIKESMQDLKTDKLAEDIAPEQRAVDISRLFEVASGDRLEKTAREGAPAATFLKGTKAYQAIEQLKYDYSQLKKLDKSLSMYGGLTEEQIMLVNEAGERLNRAEKYMTEGEKYASMLNASRATLHKLKKETGLD